MDSPLDEIFEILEEDYFFEELDFDHDKVSLLDIKRLIRELRCRG
jgi:hypothetical protein